MRIVVVGLGNVGKALLKAWHRVHPSAVLVGAADSHGSLSSHRGLSAAEILGRKERRDYDTSRSCEHNAGFISELAPNILVELPPTDLDSGSPQIPDMQAALELGCSVVTSAKSHLAVREKRLQLFELALSRGALLVDHASMLAGIPATEMRQGIGMEVTELCGVVNGTTNFILHELGCGTPFDVALQEAIDRGFAEANPAYDVEGYDVGLKLVGLTRRLLGLELDLEQVELCGISKGLRGIQGMDHRSVSEDQKNGLRWKLFGKVIRTRSGKVQATVCPRSFPADSDFGRLKGFTNAIEINGRMCGRPMNLFLRGPGAGAEETASRVLGNLNALIERLLWKKSSLS